MSEKKTGKRLLSWVLVLSAHHGPVSAAAERAGG